MAEVTTQLCEGSARQAERRFGWGRDTVAKGLHETSQVYLHPWTGPLYDIPEPPYALLVGHEVAYYASVRK